MGRTALTLRARIACVAGSSGATRAARVTGTAGISCSARWASGPWYGDNRRRRDHGGSAAGGKCQSSKCNEYCWENSGAFHKIA